MTVDFLTYSLSDINKDGVIEWEDFEIAIEVGWPSITYKLSKVLLLYPDSGISMDEEIVLGDMMSPLSYNKAEL